MQITLFLTALVSFAGVAEDAELKAQQAATDLSKATVLEGSRLGYAGAPSELVRLHRVVRASQEAERHFLQLARSASPAGRVYGLCGLKEVAAPAFKEELARFLRETQFVDVFNGCLRGPSSTKLLFPTSQPDICTSLSE